PEIHNGTMIGNPNIQIHECIFQLYLEHRIHGMCTAGVHNLLLNDSIGSPPLVREKSHNGLNLIKNIPDYLNFVMQWPSKMKSMRLTQYYGMLLKLKEHYEIAGCIRVQLYLRSIKKLIAKKKNMV